MTATSTLSPPAPLTLHGRTLRVALFVGAHIPLVIMMRALPIVSTMHAVSCVLVGMFVAATTRNLRNVTFVVAYICGSEVLWRMTRAGVFWEFGKYAAVAVLTVGLLRMRLKRNRVITLAYLGLLLPSIALTVAGEGLGRARQDISFNLSGPLALALCALFFSNLRTESQDLRRAFFAMIGPVFGIATLSFMSTRGASDLHFVNASNLTTSGGFGPNQVSAVLGIGVLFALLMLFERRLPWSLRVPLIVLSIFFGVLATLTFSRGGLALALVSAFASMLYLVRDNRRTRITLVVVASLLFAVGKYVIEPRLDAFTGGKLAERYGSSKSSGRDMFMKFDLQIFADNPVLGVGPGMATPLRQEYGFHGAAHTEYTRMLAEHGLLGAISLILLVVLAARVILASSNLRARAFSVAMIIWVGLFLMLYGMRLAAPAFLFGLACSVAYTSWSDRRASG